MQNATYLYMINDCKNQIYIIFNILIAYYLYFIEIHSATTVLYAISKLKTRYKFQIFTNILNNENRNVHILARHVFRVDVFEKPKTD